ncbi:sensor histidine kinase [Duganella violaceipulchra]|uniref:Two-component system sensor histidine kinase DesK n=1 Tax=Duganella violaceipulchra TaxID=2849652 RepID=A0ABT1GFI0_9BURK|nr:two-component system sensor histidine kinase DesK [Duganella violaceicalia]
MGILRSLKRALGRPWVPPAMGKGPYMWAWSLLFIVWKYAYVGPSPAELVWLVLTVLAFFPVYFASFWRSNLQVVPLLLFVVLLGVLWAPHNAGASTFFIFASAMCSRFERRHYAYLAIGLVLLCACLMTPYVTLKINFLVPALVVGGPVGFASIMEENMRRSRDQLLRKQEEVAHMARIAERERISRDLHDLLGHTLSMITLKAELAGKLLERDPQACRSEIRDIEQSARKALSEVRSAVTGIRQTGFAHELATARASLAAANVGFTDQVQPFVLPAALENVLSLALREAVTNILRHADASHCEVRMALESGMVVLRVRDNGRALDGGAIVHGSGLSGMKERVAALGGRLALRADRGLALELSLPMGAAA